MEDALQDIVRANDRVSVLLGAAIRLLNHFGSDEEPDQEALFVMEAARDEAIKAQAALDRLDALLRPQAVVEFPDWAKTLPKAVAA
ncbi:MULTISPECIES: hypothetical protein [unclassified Chelatococcus]|uniref:hypothetical protein n=1 Tax=unclassified Chelatococcus TaxID=2638111 RepID=UPI001BCFCF96|nr:MULTISPECIES: hypothetical protein [unclassified Chelatococcus]MBS7696223.1 hypothetical protein [Chelatococcus sp. YT9]MBX3557750.1 hypothetical protein [Chelatococcus sp.]